MRASIAITVAIAVTRIVAVLQLAELRDIVNIRNPIGDVSLHLKVFKHVQFLVTFVSGRSARVHPTKDGLSLGALQIGRA